MFGRRRRLLRLWELEARAVPATFSVLNTNDNGPGSLRQAIQDANAASDPDTIVFDNSIFATQQTITLNTGELQIRGSTDIQGPGANLLTINANGMSRA